MLISDWSSDVCSSDLKPFEPNNLRAALTILSRGDSPSAYFLETRFIRSPSLGSRHLPTLCRRPRPPRSALQISHAYMPDEQGKSTNGAQPAVFTPSRFGQICEIGEASCRERVCRYV